MHRALALLISIVACWACSATRPAGSALNERTPEPSAQHAQEPSLEARPEQALAKVPVSEADPQWGSVDAPVTLVELSDFECPFCARVQPTLEQLKQKYGPTSLRIVWKHNPLPMHAHARATHEMAAAVFMLGGSAAFFKFHDLAFANQQFLSTENLTSWASASGVSPQALTAWQAPAAQKVDEDIALAERLDASGTPAFRINGVTLAGAQPLGVFVQRIDEQLEAARKLTQGGTPPRLVYVTLTNQNVEAAAQERKPAAAEEAEDTRTWKLPVATDDPVRGDKAALVTIVEFSDFQCPFCKRVEDTLAELLRSYGKDLRVVWKDNPLPFHERALPAARLARAVYDSKGNDAFWKLHDALLSNQDSLDDDDMKELAQKQGLNWAKLEPIAKSEKVQSRIDLSVTQAGDFQARGTPHFFINGRRLSGARPLAEFKRLIDEQLTRARELVAQGTKPAAIYAAVTAAGQEPPPPVQKHVEVPAQAPSRGAPKATVVIQEFSDFQCPFCRRVEPTLVEVEQEFKGELRIVWRNFPLPFHEHAELAAEAALEVAAQKGSAAFWAYHDMLFEAQTSDDGLGRPNLEAMAAKLGVDVARFKAALDNQVHAASVKADAAAASAAGINGTPGFLINDYYLSGAQPAAEFRRLIRRALADTKQR